MSKKLLLMRIESNNVLSRIAYHNQALLLPYHESKLVLETMHKTGIPYNQSSILILVQKALLLPNTPVPSLIKLIESKIVENNLHYSKDLANGIIQLYLNAGLLKIAIARLDDVRGMMDLELAYSAFLGCKSEMCRAYCREVLQYDIIREGYGKLLEGREL